MELKRRWDARGLKASLAITGLVLATTGCPAPQPSQPKPSVPPPTTVPSVKTTLDGSLGQTIFNSGINGGMACKVCHTSASMKGRTIDQLNASNRDVPVMTQYASGPKALTQDHVAALAAYLVDPD